MIRAIGAELPRISESRARVTTRSIVRAEWLAHEVEREYAIPGITSCELLVASPRNDRYLLLTRERCFLVRIHGISQKGVSEIAYELDFMAHLALRGLPVPVPLSTRRGVPTALVRTPEGVRAVSVCQWVPTKWFRWETDDDGLRAGRALADLHSASDGFTSLHYRTPIDLDYLIAKPLEALAPLLAHRAEDAAYLHALAGRLWRALEIAARRGLSRGPCHGNWNQQDLRLAEDGSVVAVDFDCSAPGWRLLDIVGAQNTWLYQLKGSPWDAFWKGYTDRRQLSALEHDSMPLLHIVARLWRIGADAVDSTHIGAMYLSDENLDYYIQYFREWESAHASAINSSRSVAVLEVAHGHIPDVTEFELPEAPVARSILSGETVREAVAAHWDVGADARGHLLRWSSNDTYLLTGSTGRFIARVYGNTWRNTSEVAFELEFLSHLAALGVPVSAPLRSRGGDLVGSIHAPEGERQLALFDYRAGRRLSWEDDGEAALAGDLLASIHAAADSFTSPHSRARWDLEFMVDRPLRTLKPYFSRRTADWVYLENVASRLHRRLGTLAKAGLDWGICHGDYNAKNMHIDLAGRIGIFDFDWCGPGWRARDFQGVYKAGLHKPSTWRVFLAAYRAVRPLGEVDLEAVRYFPGLIHLWRLGYAVDGVSAWGSFMLDDARLDVRLAALRQWDVEESKL